MRSFVDVRHDVWIDAPRELVRDQFGDLDHHIRTDVHPTVAFRRLSPGERGLVRYERVSRVLGLRQRDVIERRHLRDGTLVDTVIDGPGRDGTLAYAFVLEARGGRLGTLVMIDARVPLPRVVGAVLRRAVAAHVMREVMRAAEQDRADIESGRYVGLSRFERRAA